MKSSVSVGTNIKSSFKLPNKYKQIFESQKVKIIQHIRSLMNAQSGQNTLQQLMVYTNRKNILPIRSLKSSDYTKLSMRKARINKLHETEKKRKSLQEMAAVVNDYYNTSPRSKDSAHFNQQVYQHIQDVLTANKPSLITKAIDKCYVERVPSINNHSPKKLISVKIEQILHIKNQQEPLQNILSPSQLKFNRKLLKTKCHTPSGVSVGGFIKSRNNNYLKDLKQPTQRRFSSTQKIHLNHIYHRGSLLVSTEENEAKYTHKPIISTKHSKVPVKKMIESIPIAAWGIEEDASFQR
jgi:hypothetical protein